MKFTNDLNLKAHKQYLERLHEEPAYRILYEAYEKGLFSGVGQDDFEYKVLVFLQTGVLEGQYIECNQSS